MNFKRKILITSLCFVLTVQVFGTDYDRLKTDEKLFQPETTLLELLSMTQQLSEFLELIRIADMEELLEGDRTVTIFIPVNNAFSALTDDILDEYRQDQEALQELLGQHIFEGELLSRFFSDGQELEMVNGHTSRISTTHMGYEIDNTTIIQIDVQASNGLIHVVNEVLLPGEDLE